MYAKTRTIGKPYSKGQIREIKRLFAILKKARHSDSVNAYTRNLIAGLKA
ncbi:MAG: hypothetical protein V1676_05725 [Candidatus Diapherotrites archaeon]